MSFPIYSNTFERDRHQKEYFIDKTATFKDLFFNEHQKLLIARPRKFGKSLLIEQLKLISMGNRDIFGPLQDEHGTVYNPQKFAVYDDEHLFNRGNATLHLDFSGLDIDSLSLSFMQELQDAFVLNGIKPPPEFPSPSKFRNADITSALLITVQELAIAPSSRAELKKPGERQVDILIDEYDSKITQPLAAMRMTSRKKMQEAEDQAVKMYQKFQAILGPLKALSPHIGLLFITGVSRFPQTNLYSSLNDLADVTFDSRYSTLFGYTRAELEGVVQKDIDPQFWEDLTKQYYGYSWRSTPDGALFNPYDLNRFLNTGKWEDYWVMQGTSHQISAYLKMCYSMHKVLPLHLIGNPPNVSIAETYIIDLEEYIPTNHLSAKDGLLSRLMTFGYLTRDPANSPNDTLSALKIPNAFVRAELEKSLKELVSDIAVDDPQATEIYEALKEKDLPRLTKAIKHWVYSTPYKVRAMDQLTESIFHVGFHSIFDTVFRSDMVFACEHMNRFGLSDIVVKFHDGPQYVIELKTGQSAQKPLQQIDTKDYKELLDPSAEGVIIGICVNKRGEVTVDYNEIKETQ